MDKRMRICTGRMGACAELHWSVPYSSFLSVLCLAIIPALILKMRICLRRHVIH